MNKKVFIAMLILTISFLVTEYVLKVFYPQEFIIAITNSRLIEIGNTIDTTVVLKFWTGFLIGLVFDFFYFGAVCKQPKLNWKLWCIIITYGLALNAYYNFAPVDFIVENTMLIIAISSCYMILTPMFFTKNIKELSITYTVNQMAQFIMLSIRQISIFTANANTLVTFILTLDNYLWIALCYIIFNYRRENNDGKFKTLLR